MGDSSETVRTMLELAKIFNVSQPRISQWKKQGMPIEVDGSYSVKKVTAWRTLKATEKVESMLPSTIEGGDLQVVNEVVSELNRFRALVDDFKTNRSDIFAGVEAKLISVSEDILDSVSRSQILAMSLKDRLRVLKDIISSVTGLYQQERLERGQSTENVKLIVQQIKELKAEQHEIEKSEFIEWVEKRRKEKIPVPSHAMENLKDKARIFNISIDGLIFKDTSSTS